MNVLHDIGIARGGCLLLACAAITFESGCAARLYSQPGQASPVVDDAVVYVDTVPANIDAYPHYYYGDGYAYYVDGRWYHHGTRGWGYYRQEPAELQIQLQRQRGYVQQAPAPVVRERPYVQQAPDAPRERPYVQQAPAARRADPGVVEAQPRRPEPRRAPPSDKRADPHEERGR